MGGRSLRQFRLDDEAVLRGVDVAFEQAESDLDVLGIALADLDVARLELSPTRTNTTVRFSTV